MNWASLLDRPASGPSKATDKISAQPSRLPPRALLGMYCLQLQCCPAASRVCCWPQQDQGIVNEASSSKGICHPYVKWVGEVALYWAWKLLTHMVWSNLSHTPGLGWQSNEGLANQGNTWTQVCGHSALRSPGEVAGLRHQEERNWTTLRKAEEIEGSDLRGTRSSA